MSALQLSHLVEHLEFAVAFPTQALAFEQQECLAHFASRAAPRILDEVFDAVGTRGRVLRLEQLAIDLGTVHGPDLVQQWEQRLRQQLHDALSTLLDQTTVMAPTESVTTEHAVFEAFWYFLQYGHLPWHARNGDTAALTAMAREVLSHSGERLVQALRRAGRGSAALRRMVQQLPVPALAEFAGRWLGQGRELFDAIERATALSSAHGIRELAQLPVRPALWQAALARLLESPAPPPSDALIETLTAALAEGGHEAADSVIASLRSASSGVELHILRRQLQAGLLHDLSCIAESTWESLLQRDAAWLRATLASHGRSARVRRRLVQSLTEPRLWVLAALWLPADERDFVRTVMSCRALQPAFADVNLWNGTLTYLWTAASPTYERQKYVAHLLRQLLGADEATLSRLQQQLLEEGAASVPGDTPSGNLPSGNMPSRNKLESELQQLLRALVSAALAQEGTEHAVVIEQRLSSDASVEGFLDSTTAGNEPAGHGTNAETQLLKSRLTAALQGGPMAAQIAPTLEALLQRDAGTVAELLRRADRPMFERLLRVVPTAMRRTLLELWLRPHESEFVSALLDSAALLALLHSSSSEDAAARCWACVLSQITSLVRPFEPAGCIDSLLLQLLAQQALDPVRASQRWLAVASQSGAASDLIEQQLLQRVQVLTAALATTSARPEPLVQRPAGEAGKADVADSTRPAWIWRIRLEALGNATSVGTQRMWQALLSEDAAWLKQALQRLGRSARVRRRLALGLPRACLQQLAALWLPAAEQGILESLLQQPVVLEHAAPRLLWELVLGLLLLEQRVASSAPLLVDALLRQLCVHAAVDPRQLIEQLAMQLRAVAPAGNEARLLQILAELSATNAVELQRLLAGRSRDALPEEAPQLLKSQLAAALQDGSASRDQVLAAGLLDAPASHADSAVQAATEASRSREIHAAGSELQRPTTDTAAEHAVAQSAWFWRVRLESSLAAPDSVGTAQMWQALLSEDAAWLKQELQRLGRSAHVRRRLALGLPKSCLQQLAGLWLPATEQGILNSLLQQAILLGHAAPRLLWELVLGILLLQQHVPLSASLLVDVLLQQLAVQLELDAPQLIEQLTAHLRAGAPTDSEVQLLKILDALHATNARAQPQSLAGSSRDAWTSQLTAGLQSASGEFMPALQILLRQDAAAVAGLLREADQTMWERLLRAVPSAMRRQLLELWLTPSASEFVNALLDSACLPALLPSGNTDAVHCWVCVLSHISSQSPASQSPAFEPTSCIDSLLLQLLAKQELDPAQVCRQWLAVVQARATGGRVEQQLLQRVQLLNVALAPASDSSLQGAAGQTQVTQAQSSGAVPPAWIWRVRLESALAAADTGTLQMWQILMSEDAAWLKSALQRLGRSARVRRRLVVGLPKRYLEQLAALWLPPAAQRALGALLAQDLLLEYVAPRQLWELVLEVLWLERRPIASTPLLVDVLLRQLAAHASLDAQQLIERLATQLRAAAPTQGDALLLQALDVLCAAGNRAPQQTVVAGRSADTLVQGPPSLVAALRGRGASSEIVPTLQALLQQDSAAVAGVLRGADRQMWEHLLRAAPAATRRAILELWLQPHDSQPVSALLEGAALRALQPASGGEDVAVRGWVCVLSHVVGLSQSFELDACIDSLLVQLLAGGPFDPQHAAARWLAVAGAHAAEDGLEQRLLQRAQTLAALLDKSDSPAGESRVTVAAAEPAAQPEWIWRIHLESALATDSVGAPQMWQTLLTRDAAWLKQALQRLGRSAGVRRRLALGLPKSCLQQLVGLWLRPPQQRLFCSLLDQDVLLEHAAPRLLWEFALGLLLLERSDVPAALPLVDALLHQLAAHAGLERSQLIERLQALARSTDDPQWLDMLAELASQLRAASGTDTAQQRLLQALSNNDRAAGAAARQPTPDQTCLPQLLEYLGGAAADLTAPQRWREQLSSLLAHSEPRLRRELRLALETATACGRLIELLTEPQLQRVLQLLQPLDHMAIRSTASAILGASRAVDTGCGESQCQRWSWQFILRECCEEGRVFEAAGFALRLVEQLVHWVSPADPLLWRQQLQSKLSLRPVTHGFAASAVCDEQLIQSITSTLAASVQEARTTLLPATTCDAINEAGAIYIANAGLVLAAAYLPRLFAMLNLTGESGFIDGAAAQRAVHLCQYVVSGAVETPEYQLMLNKLLCGVALAEPVSSGIEIQAREREAVEGMLGAMIQHWKVLGRTSIAGLRETFLQREGQLTRCEDHWQLLVEPRPFDMLLDQLPWGYATVKFPWMPQVIHVEWR